MRHKERVNEYLAVCQLGITAVTLALTVAFEPAVKSIVEPLLKSSLSPKPLTASAWASPSLLPRAFTSPSASSFQSRLALISPEQLVARFARLIEYFTGSPARRFGSSTASRRGLQARHGTTGQVESEVIDIHEALVKSHRSGKIDESQFELFDAVLDYRDRMVREVMTPRSELVYIDPAAPAEVNLKYVTENFYTRFPVISDGIVKGIRAWCTTSSPNRPLRINWKKITRPLPRVPETLTLPRVHRAMKGSPIAAVFDEYNQFVGIITHADIDEEIMGELLDEDDDEILPLIQPDGEGGFIVNAVSAPSTTSWKR